jgi:methionyl-tRNA formyltransferase
MKSLRIIFMGSPDFAVPSLRKLHGSTHEISAVVTGPDKRRGRGTDKSPTVIKKTATELGLPILETDNLRDNQIRDELIAHKPDLFVVVAFKILPPGLLSVPSIGSVNLHASLLPKYRGAAPIHHAVMNGETETGCTVFFLDEHVDTGNILLQEKTTISTTENTGSVYARLMDIGAELLVKSVDMIATGNYTLKKQDDRLATPAPKIFPEDCRIDFSENSDKVLNKIRGLNPFPGAWTTIDGQRLRIHEAAPAPAPASSTPVDVIPGSINFFDGKIIAGCKDGYIELVEVQLEGKKPVNAVDFFRGYKGLRQII